MGSLASTYRDQGRWKEAEGLEMQVMEKRKRILGQVHPSTLNSMANLASIYGIQGGWKEAEELLVQIMEMFIGVLGQDHPDTLTTMASLATTYLSPGQRAKAKELQIKAVNQLWTTLGEDYPPTVTAITSLAPAREERTAPAPFCGTNDLTKHFRDRNLRFATSWSLDQGKEGQERLKSAFEMSQKHATEHGNGTTEVGGLQPVLSVSLEVGESNDASEDKLRRPLYSSSEADADHRTNAKRLQCAPVMSMVDGNHNDSIGSFQAASVEPDEGNETDAERLQRTLVISVMSENDCEEFAASKENISGRIILVVSTVYCLVANMRRQIASRPLRRGYKARAHNGISTKVVGVEQ